MSTLERQLIELEIRISHYEDGANELSEGLISQQRRIDHLERRVKHLQARIEELTNLPDQPIDEPPPPHY